MNSEYDAIVVGSGPNGLAAAITIARAGFKVKVLEASSIPGGGTRTEELTLSGFQHDICSAVHPLAIASPFFSSLPLQDFGLEWIVPPAAVAQTLEGGRAVLLETSVDETAAELEQDKASYLALMKPFAQNWQGLFDDVLKPFLHLPSHPILLARFGLLSMLSGETLFRRTFNGERAQALFAGIAAHANSSLERMGTAAIGMMLGVAGHARGWPIPKGGAKKISDAMVRYLVSLGGEVVLNERVNSLNELPSSRWKFFDLTPRQLAAIFAGHLSPRHIRQMEKYQYGPGVFKMDWALAEPIPWLAKEIRRSATVHVAASAAEIVASERLPELGKCPEKPYVLLSQPTLFDSTRAPSGKHIAWAYCHVPNGSTEDMSGAIENQIERFAPGFRDIVLAKSCLAPAQMEAKNANLIGGDISGGAVNLRQLLFRPAFRINPYRLPLDGHYICSSSTPPGPGVHGMCGYNAALDALKGSET